MKSIRFSYDGQLLVSQLAAYGLACALDGVGIEAYVGHDPSHSRSSRS